MESLPAMDLFRSQKITLVQLIIPVESADRVVSYLGELGLIQFRDRFQGPAYRMIGASEIDSDIDNEADSGRCSYKEYNFSKAFVRQIIHSVEFVPGAVSNAAS